MLGSYKDADHSAIILLASDDDMRFCAEQQATECFTDDDTDKCQEVQDTPEDAQFIGDDHRVQAEKVEWKKTQQGAPPEIEAGGAARSNN